MTPSSKGNWTPHIDLLLGASLPHRPAYKKKKEIQNQVEELINKE